MPDAPTALDQFRPANLAREVLAHPERYKAGVVEWAKRVVEDEVTRSNEWTPRN